MKVVYETIEDAIGRAIKEAEARDKKIRHIELDRAEAIELFGALQSLTPWGKYSPTSGRRSFLKSGTIQYRGIHIHWSPFDLQFWETA